MNPIEKITISTIAKGGVATPFPYKLHIMLDSMDTEALKGNNEGKSIVGWQPHGRAFKVHHVEKFVETIMPHYFKQTKYASFQRQLNLYGFVRITVGPDKGAVYHPCFVRNQPKMIHGMVRRRVKGTKIRKAVLPECQPNFYAHEKLWAIAAVDTAFDATCPRPSIVRSGPPPPPTEPIKPILRKQFLPIEQPPMKGVFPQPSMKFIQPLSTQRYALMHYNHNSGEKNLSLI